MWSKRFILDLTLQGAAKTFEPDIVFLDIGFPGMRGYEVAQQLRSDPATRGLICADRVGIGR